jgi:aspartyl-tRNA(Asn)/glutamyl-tRNA(Gln) amidotransferase subunit B
MTTFSAGSGELRAMRTKEQSHDYRYFPEPDLPTLTLSGAGLNVAEIAATLPELPAAKRARFLKEYGLPEYDAGVLAATATLGDYFERVVREGADGKAAANWVMGSVLQDANENADKFRVTPPALARLADLVKRGTLSHLSAKQVFQEMAANGGDAAAVAERLGLVQVGDADQIGAWVDAVLAERSDEVRRYQAGEVKLIGFLVGEVMKRSKGKADPKAVQGRIKQALG